MRITDLSVTMFEWRGLPAASYSDKNPSAAATPELGLISIEPMPASPATRSWPRRACHRRAHKTAPVLRVWGSADAGDAGGRRFP